MKGSLFVILLTVFLDAVGVGLVYPIASPLLLDTGPHAFLPLDFSPVFRGLLLGVLMASFTIGQFFMSPLIGGLSDLKGRRKVVLGTLFLSIFSYIVGGSSIHFKNITGLFISRFLAGAAAGNAAVMQASMADMSSPQEKATRFGWLGASFGVGFIMGPFLGGKLSDPAWGCDFSVPFWAAAALSLFNLSLAYVLFKETSVCIKKVKIHLWTGLFYLKRAFQLKAFRSLFSVMFLYFFGWELFIVFGPVFLMDRFRFSPSQIGNFYAYIGFWFVVSNGLFMRLTARFSPERVLQVAFPFWAIALFALDFVKTPALFWLALAPIPGIGAIIFSTGSALVSNLSHPEIQGETLGIYSSVQAAALALPPLCTGSLVALYPSFPLLAGSGCLIMASLLWWMVNMKKKGALENAPEK